MRASFGVAKKSADALVEFGADDVFELAGLRVRFRVVDGKSVFEEAFGQAVAAHNTTSALAADGRELYFPVLHLYQVQIGHARQNPRCRLFRNDWEFSGLPRSVQ